MGRGARRIDRLALVSRTYQFGRHRAEFHLAKEKIAHRSELTFAMASLTGLAAGMVDRHDGAILLGTASGKLFCAEMGWQVIDDAVQVHGGLVADAVLAAHEARERLA